MTRLLRLLACSVTLAALAPAGALAAPGDTTRISLSDAEAQPAQAASGAALSADGRHVLFTSTADLAGVPTGGVTQLYVRDRVAGTTRLVSASAAGAAANGEVDDDPQNVPYAISADGRYATFASVATNLVALDQNAAQRDVFRKDLVTGEVVVASVNDAGQQANQGVQGNPDISADGSRITYVTGTATNLITGGDANGVAMDVVVRDVPAGRTILVSQSTAGVQAADFTERPAISADGRVVAFEAGMLSDNLVPGDDNNASDAFVRDLAAGTTTRVSVTTAGQTPGNVNFPDVSGDGRYVSFQSSTAYDPANDANASSDVYRRDVALGQTTLVSAANGGDTAGGDARLAAISADGSRVAFESTADLLPPDGNAADADVYVRDVATKTVERADVPQPANAATGAGISANGALVAFTYDDAPAAPFMAGDTNQLADVFVREFVPSDGTPPPLALTTPAEGATTADASVVVTGSGAADPSGLVALTVNGAPLTPAADGTFSTSVALTAGANTITVTAVDGAGNAVTITRTVQRSGPSSPGTTPGTGTPGPGASGKLRPRALTVKVTPGRDLRPPFRFAISGRLTMPRGVGASAGCRGSVTIRVRVGARVVRTLRPRLARRAGICAYRSSLRIRSRRGLGAARALRVSVRFAGNARLLARNSRTVSVRIRR